MTYDAYVPSSTLDSQGLNQLRWQANQTTPDQETLRQVAGQFESLFINMMLKSMRQASLAEGIFDSNQSKMYQDLADQQMAADLAKRGGMGLQDVILRQLSGYAMNEATPVVPGQSYSIDTVTVRPSLGIKVNEQIIDKIKSVRETREVEAEPIELSPVSTARFNSPEQFVEQLWPYAQRAAERLGVAPEVILSQAALETGWGKHILSDANGETSFNLFNIKAHGGWQGDTTSKNVLEYRHGKPLYEQAAFRAYDSYQQSFDDYVDFLQSQPRYQTALQHTSNPAEFIEQVHKAGYATDPLYADKIKRIMNSDTLAQISLDLF